MRINTILEWRIYGVGRYPGLLHTLSLLRVVNKLFAPPPTLPDEDEFELDALAPFADDDDRTTLCGELPRRTTLDCCGEFCVTITNFWGGWFAWMARICGSAGTTGLLKKANQSNLDY